MKIMGIDPGTLCCGYGIIEAERSKDKALHTRGKTSLRYITSGEIKLKRNDPLPLRLKVLYDSLGEIIKRYKPSHLCLEKIFYHRSFKTAFTLGSIRGIAMLLAAENDMSVYEYNSTELKMALTGYGRADKTQVQEMVKRLLSLYHFDGEISKDSTDALALCICHVHSLNP
jgi:crossover junction endodeoxyribonuclease RuvC